MTEQYCHNCERWHEGAVCPGGESVPKDRGVVGIDSAVDPEWEWELDFLRWAIKEAQRDRDRKELDETSWSR